jgi:hypothetical protein
MHDLYRRKLGSNFITLQRQSRLVFGLELVPQIRDVCDRVVDLIAVDETTEPSELEQTTDQIDGFRQQLDAIETAIKEYTGLGSKAGVKVVKKQWATEAERTAKMKAVV